jgi:hypothetical protein
MAAVAIHLPAGILQLTAFRMARHATAGIVVVLRNSRKTRSEMCVQNLDRFPGRIGCQTFASFLLLFSIGLVTRDLAPPGAGSMTKNGIRNRPGNLDVKVGLFGNILRQLGLLIPEKQLIYKLFYIIFFLDEQAEKSS